MPDECSREKQSSRQYGRGRYASRQTDGYREVNREVMNDGASTVWQGGRLAGVGKGEEIKQASIQTGPQEEKN